MSTIKICDICSSKKCSEISLCIGDQMSPAGDRDYNFEKYDLCSECLSVVISAYFKNRDYIDSELFSEIIKKAISVRQKIN